nr:MAG TPA: hypothetical protein [Caudoviricetes sp.]
MKKVIEKKLEITSNNRDVDRLYQEFFSMDKNIAGFKFTLDNLAANKVICLFYFKKSKRYSTVEATIEENTFNVKFDTSLITMDEPVVGYIYFEKVEKSADVYSFQFNVRVSELDKSKNAPVIEQKTGRVVDIENIVTRSELEEILKTVHVGSASYDDSEIIKRLAALEAKPGIDTSQFATKEELANKVERSEISNISADIELLKTKPDNNTIYDDSALKQRISVLESKPDKDTVYNDSEIKSRLENLENKPGVDTSSLVTKQELESKGYLLQHQNLDGYAKKSEIPQPYNDTEIKQRLATVEQKGQSYATKEQLASIPKTPQKLSIEGNTLILSDGGGNVTLPTSSQNASSTSTSSSELIGEGMPNGKVDGTLGQTYVDTRKTNGALKWIKRTASGNQGWAVLDGDTGWKALPVVSKLGGSYIQIRRINDTVYYQFGGLSWGWFGILRRGAPGYIPQPSDRDRNVYVLNQGSIPYGYRSFSSLIGQIFNDKGIPYGTWYLGGQGDGNQLRFQFLEPVPENKDIGDIRVSSISYVTNDPWPTT